MAIKKQVIAEAVWKLIGDSNKPKRVARSVASYLVAERRTKELPALLRILEEHQLEANGRLEVTATTAVPLSDGAKQAIIRLFDAKDIMIHEEINSSVVGGVRVRALDKVADLSVQARLRQLRHPSTFADRNNNVVNPAIKGAGRSL